MSQPNKRPFSEIFSRWIVKIVIGIVILFVVKALFVKMNSSVNKTESVDNDRVIKEAVYSSLDSILADSDSKTRACNCILNKIEKHYPKGYNSIPKDSINAIAYRFGFACVKETPNLKFKAWQFNMRAKMKQGILDGPLLKQVKEQYRDTLAGCFVDEVIKEYPNGLTGMIPGGIRDSLLILCANKVKDIK